MATGDRPKKPDCKDLKEYEKENPDVIEVEEFIVSENQTDGEQR